MLLNFAILKRRKSVVIERKTVKKTRKILLIFVVFALALPTGIFASVKNVQNSGGQTSAQIAQLVRVVALKTSAVVTSPALASPNTGGCSSNTAPTQNLIQNAEAVNLNQPASCFGLALARPVSQPKLTVVMPRQSVAIIVPSPNRILGAPSYVPMPAAQGSALPGLVFVFSGIILFEEKRIIRKLAVRLSAYIAQNLTLHQLGVLRC
jgi:hypothetical protein